MDVRQRGTGEYWLSLEELYYIFVICSITLCMARYSPLSLTAQTAFAELFDVVQAADISRTVSSLSGSFATKQLKGREYHYFQYREIDGTVKQIYVGPRLIALPH